MTGHRRAMWPWRAAICSAMLLGSPVVAQPGPAAEPLPRGDRAQPAAQSGRDIYQRFRAGLADPHCEAASSSPRWRKHFAAAPARLAARNDDLLPLFGYVVDALRDAGLPTEYALIPFVESGYKPGARSPAGPAGLWQMITLTARNHHVPINAGYDGRLSPIDSTKAAVRYLKTLHGMFAGDWRLAVMAYNAGEYRILSALKRNGKQARNANPELLAGLPDITQAYVRKLHALSCLMEQADDREDWLRALDRPVPRLAAVRVPDDVADIAAWAARSGQDAAQLLRLNPVFGSGRIGRVGTQRAPLLAIAPLAMGALVAPTRQGTAIAVQEATAGTGPVPATDAPALPDPAAKAAAGRALAPRRHTVARGDNAGTIARRYGIGVAELLQRNQLAGSSVLKPGTVLRIDAAPGRTLRESE